jgi:hypothetical protein
MFNLCDDKLQGATRAFVAIPYPRPRTFNPLCYPASRHTFGADEGIILEGEPKGHGLANVSPERGALHSNDCVGEVWQRDTSQSGPE